MNLGDTLLHEKEWQTINKPDVLMIPIGGKAVHNTMDVPEALQAVNIMRPKLVIPCHYNCPGFFTKTLNPADAGLFKMEANKTGAKCEIMLMGDPIIPRHFSVAHPEFPRVRFFGKLNNIRQFQIL